MMKIKLFLILTVLIFAVSCSKQTTDPTVNNNNPSSEDLKDYGTP